MLRLILTVVLLVITACGTGSLGPNSEPTSQLVQRAITLQLHQIQQQSQQVGFDFRGFKINRVAITQQQPTSIQGLPAYRVQGTYDLTLKLRRRRVQQQNPFEIYLQHQKEGKTWRLALPQTTKNTQAAWRTYLVP